MKWLILALLLLTGCSYKPPISNGLKTDGQLMQEDGLVRCEGFCYTEAQGFSEIMMFGPGGCICDNRDGNKIRKHLKESLTGFVK